MGPAPLNSRFRQPQAPTTCPEPSLEQNATSHELRATINDVKNIQVIDGADNCVYDIFQATEDEFDLIFPSGQDVAFIDEVRAGRNETELDAAFEAIWKRRIPKNKAQGIHGILFYELASKKAYYPTRKDEEAVNPSGSSLR